MSIISNPTKRIIPENFHVSLSEDFTQENCDFNKLLWCNELKPEWFGAIEHMGLTYAGHCLMSSNKLKGARTHGLVQLFRPGINPKYAEIKASIHTTGKDIREQPTFVLCDDDDNPIILIDTNTVDDIYEKGGAQNRIVAKFIKNESFDEANLIACGTYFNSLGLPSGINDIQNLEFSLRKIIEVNPVLVLSKGADPNTVSKVVDQWKCYLNFMSAKINLGTSEVNNIINNIVEEQTGKRQSINTTGPFVLDEIAKKQKCITTPDVRYTALSPWAEKLFSHWRSEFNKHIITHPNAGEFIIRTIIHMGAADLSDPVRNFLARANKFYDKYKLERKFVSDAKNIQRCEVKGVYQNVGALEDIWPVGSIVTFDEIEEYQSSLDNAIAVELEDDDEVEMKEHLDTILGVE